MSGASSIETRGLVRLRVPAGSLPGRGCVTNQPDPAYGSLRDEGRVEDQLPFLRQPPEIPAVRHYLQREGWSPQRSA